ncbi:MAG: CopG family transcriptional regulator [Myxococcota bacterium]
MRTTVDIQDELLIKARRLATERGIALSTLIEEALASRLAQVETECAPFVLRWQSHRGVYIGGVDLADRDELHELMEGADSAHPQDS